MTTLEELEGYNSNYPILYSVLQPSAPEYEQDNDKKKYYKNLSKLYKEKNHDLYMTNVDLLKKIKKLKNENKKINTELLQEMENNAILESKLVFYRYYEKIIKQKKKLLQYCYIPKKLKLKK